MYKFNDHLLSLPFPEIVNELTGYVCYKYDITKEELKSECRDEHLCQARNVLYHICKLFDVPNTYIVTVINRDRTLCYNYDKWIRNDKNRRIINSYVKIIEFTLAEQKKIFNIKEEDVC